MYRVLAKLTLSMFAARFLVHLDFGPQCFTKAGVMLRLVSSAAGVCQIVPCAGKAHATCLLHILWCTWSLGVQCLGVPCLGFWVQFCSVWCCVACSVRPCWLTDCLVGRQLRATLRILGRICCVVVFVFYILSQGLPTGLHRCRLTVKLSSAGYCADGWSCSKAVTVPAAFGAVDCSCVDSVSCYIFVWQCWCPVFGSVGVPVQRSLQAT